MTGSWTRLKLEVVMPAKMETKAGTVEQALASLPVNTRAESPEMEGTTWTHLRPALIQRPVYAHIAVQAACFTILGPFAADSQKRTPSGAMSKLQSVSLHSSLQNSRRALHNWELACFK